MDKRAYYIEVPELDFALLVMDDGEEEGILSGMSEDARDHFCSALETEGYEVQAFRSMPTTFESGRKGRRWRRLQWEHRPSAGAPLMETARING